MEELVEAMRTELGPAHVLTEAADLVGFDLDGRGAIGRAGALVRPGDPGQVSTVLRLAAAHDVRVAPQGARTGLVGGGAADDAAAVMLMSLDRLNTAPVVDPINRTAVAGAGVRLSALNAAAAEHGLTFPIDLGADPSVGGMVSANTGGAKFLRFGDVRRNVLGLQIVMADGRGTRLDLGGPLWKDNSGLDLKQMFIGAGGALGVVTEATLALQPLPTASVTALLALANARVGVALLCTLERACGALVTAFEGISPAAYEAALAHVPRLRRPFQAGAAAFYVLVELSAGAAITSEQLEEMLASVLATWLQREEVLDVAVDRGAGLWSIRHAVPEGLRAMGQVVACDIALRRGDVCDFRERVGAEIASRFTELLVCDFGHIGDGGLHFNMVWPREKGAPPPRLLDDAKSFVLSAAVETFGGSFSAEHGIGPRNIAYYERWTPDEQRALAGAVQSVFAPSGIGRVSFGLSSKEATHV